MGSGRTRRKKERQLRAARRRLAPIRGARGRSLRHRRVAAPRVVGLSQFAAGLTGQGRPWTPATRATTWVLSVLLVVIVVILVVARLTKHL